MTLSDEVQDLFSERGLDRADALVVAKRLGRQIVEESRTTETPLEDVVYEVWGLYDDGKPACWFTREKGDGNVLFTGTFRTKNGGAYVERRRRLSPDELCLLADRDSSA